MVARARSIKPAAVLNICTCKRPPRSRPDECTVTGPACEAVERAATLDDFAAICRDLADTLPTDAASLLSSMRCQLRAWALGTGDE